MSDEVVPQSLTVNAESRTVAFPVHHTLLEVLREELGLTGTKHGCELGECGTCTVLVDGQPVLSCLALAAEMEGRAIETVEGLQQGNALHPLQAAFADLGAAQCGYCTPGILMTAKALLAKRGISYEEINLARDPEGRAELVRLTGMMTFPQVVIDGEALGGYQELVKADRDGALTDLAEAAA